jgi:hypothetical protein
VRLKTLRAKKGYECDTKLAADRFAVGMAKQWISSNGK